jgi:Fe-S-cluster containining protein
VTFEYCTKCGECCKFIDAVLPVFPEFEKYITEDGTCMYFNQKTKLCNIYENRPDPCRWEKVHTKFFSDMTVDDFKLMNLKFCKEIQYINEGKQKHESC